MKQFTVTEITRLLKNLIESNFDDIISVEGEISNLSISPSGHIYFVLKDENAQIKVALFKKFVLLNRGYTPKNGDNVVVYGELTVYEADGSYQIIARKVEYREIGIFYKKFEETKRKLEAEGLFDKIIKKKIPDIIERVAVITSPNGAAFKDFMKVLRDNRVSLEIHLWGVQVQGAQAVNEIVTALNNVSRYGNYDLVILMRGGGSLEDLAIFNDELIARGVSNQKNPTITAIGHERDTTIVDFVADMRVPTPTAAANVIVDRFNNLRNRVENYGKEIVISMDKIFFKRSQRFDILALKLEKNSPSARIGRIKDFLLLCKNSMVSLLNYKIKDFDSALDYFSAYIKNNGPSQKLDQFKSRLELIEHKIKNIMLNKEKAMSDYISNVEFMMRSLNPDNLLKKGYCIVKNGDRIVSDIMDVSLEDILEIKVKNGYIKSSVIAKKILEE